MAGNSNAPKAATTSTANPANALIVVPVHGNKSLKPGLQRAILKLAGIEV